MTAPENPSAAPSSLRRVVLTGGAYLMGRQVLSVCLKLIGVLLITRALGPSAYGAYVAAFALYQYAIALGSAGIGVYLLRMQGEVGEAAYGTMYVLLAGLAIILFAAIELGRRAFGHWMGVDGFESVAAIIAFALPLQLLTIPANVRLERALNYKPIALIEIVGQACYYAVALLLVWFQARPEALAISLIVQNAIVLVLSHVATRGWQRFAFDRSVARQMLRYAVSFSAANWIWQLRMLLNPMIVGPALGAQAVGLIGMAIGLLEMLSIVKTIAWRLSVSMLGRFQQDAAKLRRAVTEGMELQVLAVGAILLGFGWTGGVLVPLVFGARWAPVMDVYPYLAVGYLAAAPFNMHSAALSVLNRNKALAVAFAIHVALFASVAYLAVPRYGMIGYGMGEIAAILAYGAVHMALAREIGSPDYRLAAVWGGAAAIGLFWQQLGLWTVAMPFAALLAPISLRRLASYYRQLRKD
ncbi:oligosaccharide flippase family protein [Bosea sp. TND4EK4]|uniref:oligosaccharide flippase family protein n=1 Tax=Bosea sp. TND4EK4 TaxID=1907408 RepID=UPI0009555A3A|nr:oligosaccharide flippase family protein [Bosea sp. TND4EK4]SIR47432.1 polysaccharide transporter, PST family [Bosea sp. TND4EK4]